MKLVAVLDFDEGNGVVRWRNVEQHASTFGISLGNTIRVPVDRTGVAAKDEDGGEDVAIGNPFLKSISFQ